MEIKNSETVFRHDHVPQTINSKRDSLDSQMSHLREEVRASQEQTQLTETEKVEKNPIISHVEKTPLQKNMKTIIEALNHKMMHLNQDVRFGFSDEMSQLYVRIYERDSNRLIRTIPSEAFIEMVKRFRELSGTILNQSA
jgi:uncharacterized FlaG/YvyC family protein